MHPGCDIQQVYLCREPVDFRKSINGLGVLVEQELGLKANWYPEQIAVRGAHTVLGLRYNA